MNSTPSDNHVPDPDFDSDSENLNGMQAFNRLGQFLEENNWNAQHLPDKHVYRLNFQGQNGIMPCYAQIRIEAEQLLFYAMAPIKVEEPVRPAVAEYLTRANYGLYIGNFELDFSDGEVRYKSSLDFEDAELNFELIRNTMYPAMQMMDRYLPGLLKVAFGSKSPEEAIQEIEG